MNRVFRIAMFRILSLVLIGTMCISPLTAQDRGRARSFSSGLPGLLSDVLRDASARSELALTQDQIDKLQKVAEGTNFFGKVGPLLQKLRSAETDAERLSVREEMRDAMEALALDVETQARQILTEPQFQRAMELHLQRQGSRALTRTDVGRDLGLTAAQAEQLKGLMLEYEAARSQLGFGSSEEDRRKLGEDHETKMLGVLTDEQKAKWTARQGKPFQFDAVPSPPSLSGQGLSPSRSSRDRLPPSAARSGIGSPAAVGGPAPPSSYGMIDEDSIGGPINFVVLAEVLAARGRTLSLNRDQVQLLTNLETRTRFDRRISGLRQRLTEAKTLEECAAIRTESCLLLEEWNAEVEREIQKIIGDESFAKLRPAILKRQGLWALTRPDVAGELKLTPEQSAQLKLILDEYRTAAAAASADATPQERSRLAAPFEQKMLEVLTPDQKAQWPASRGTGRSE